jgi:uncharacterized protein
MIKRIRGVRGISLIILFGSQAKGRTHKNSDTDIAVLADHSLGLEELQIVSIRIARDRGVSEDSVDVVDVRTASPLLQWDILRVGVLLYGSEFDFVRFKVMAWKRYCDTARFRRAREALFDKLSYVS